MQRHAFAIAFTALVLGTLATGCPFSVETFHKHCAVPKDCDDGIECTDDKCTAGLCENTPKPKETGCGPTKASVCDGKGECVECLTNTDCMANHAMRPICDTDVQKCVSCNDGVQNGKETDVDCGGPDCGACLGQPCDPTNGCGNKTLCAPKDNICCKTACDQLCEACTMAKTGQQDGTCAAIPYSKDPDGECSTPGPLGGGCGDTPNTCRCGDGVKNADETDIDCGGPTCSRCEGGKSCNTDADCAADVPNCLSTSKTCCSSVCDSTCFFCNGGGQCLPQVVGFPDPTCPSNQVCGPVGTTCVGKAGATCSSNGKCLSQSCIAGTCAKSAGGKPCSDNNDCFSGNCQNHICF